MNIRIVEETSDALAEYATIPIAYRVESLLRIDLVRAGLGGILFTEDRVERPYTKDYDALGEERPTEWAKRWDLSNWGIISALDDAQRVGGAIVAWNTPGVDMLRGQRDVAVLWDIRVAPEYRRSGVGSRLFSHASAWARERGCRRLSVETQNINVAACRFYVRHGCRLGALNRYAYPAIPEETQLIWWLDL